VTAVTPGDVVIGLVESNGLQEELTCPEFMFDMVSADLRDNSVVERWITAVKT